MTNLLFHHKYAYMICDLIEQIVGAMRVEIRMTKDTREENSIVYTADTRCEVE